MCGDHGAQCTRPSGLSRCGVIVVLVGGQLRSARAFTAVAGCRELIGRRDVPRRISFPDRSFPPSIGLPPRLSLLSFSSTRLTSFRRPLHCSFFCLLTSSLHLDSTRLCLSCSRFACDCRLHSFSRSFTVQSFDRVSGSPLRVRGLHPVCHPFPRTPPVDYGASNL